MSYVFYILCFTLSLPNPVHILHLNRVSHVRLTMFQVLNCCIWLVATVLDRASPDLVVLDFVICVFYCKPPNTLRNEIFRVIKNTISYWLGPSTGYLTTLCLNFLIYKRRIIVLLSGLLWGRNEIMHVNCSLCTINVCYHVYQLYFWNYSVST